MMRRFNTRQGYLAVALAVVFVAVVVPTCQMVGCTMSGGTMPFHGMQTLGFFGTCGGMYIGHSAPAAVVPTSFDALLLALAAVLILAAALVFRTTETDAAFILACEPPPPPLEPRGMRLRI